MVTQKTQPVGVGVGVPGPLEGAATGGVPRIHNPERQLVGLSGVGSVSMIGWQVAQ